ncbi:helix-turn-helix transcriptional regulator [Bradyrhizobium sp. sGM-13]|uniref:helix-turn-helix transcriptional regulator n=1 Tax=Bradyrhizobium sp. sGM-13 TaxID=2831781 RepID=UPI001BD16DDF|nr:helix-turn-helix transcriptional regulator [Bradyrhizobium sp. sGM-13]
MIAGQNVSSATSALPRGVRRALDAMRANLGHSWRLTELAAIGGVSGRTLQRQFLSFVGKTPRAVLREIGLECARRELLQGTPDIKIMDVALRSGFPHFGRFSIEYRRRYGETPSQTLKRQEVLTDALGAMLRYSYRGETGPCWRLGRSKRLRSIRRSQPTSPMTFSLL